MHVKCLTSKREDYTEQICSQISKENTNFLFFWLKNVNSAEHLKQDGQIDGQN